MACVFRSSSRTATVSLSCSVLHLLPKLQELIQAFSAPDFEVACSLGLGSGAFNTILDREKVATFSVTANVIRAANPTRSSSGQMIQVPCWPSKMACYQKNLAVQKAERDEGK